MIEAFSTGFYNKIIANAALQTKLGGGAGDKKIYNTHARQNSVVPYLVFGVLTDVPMADFADPATIEDMTFYVNIFTPKASGVEYIHEVADLVKTAMDNVVLTITGYTSMLCMREYTSSVLWDSETGIYQMSLRYRVMGSKN